jgi:hypothetical protein
VIYSKCFIIQKVTQTTLNYLFVEMRFLLRGQLWKFLRIDSKNFIFVKRKESETFEYIKCDKFI